jgi:group I intron endonuclease
MIGIYKITSPNNRVYIGQSIDIEKRFRKYKGLHCKRQIALYNSFLKYGVDKHKFEVITECTIEELNNLERYYQDLHNVLNNECGLNLKLTNSNDRMAVFSEETRVKISESVKKLYKNGYVHPGLGKKMSAESCKKNSEAQKKLYKNGYINPSKDKKFTEEHKLKLSVAHKKLYKNGYIVHNAKKVINTETGEMYNSAAELCRILNINHKGMCRKLSGERKNNTPFKYIQQ